MLVSRSGDSQGITLTQVGITFGIFAALIGAVLQVSGALNEHNESDVAHPKAEKELDIRVNEHNKNRFAHPEMRQMIREELVPIKQDTEAIRKAIEAMQ